MDYSTLDKKLATNYKRAVEKNQVELFDAWIAGEVVQYYVPHHKMWRDTQTYEDYKKNPTGDTPNFRQWCKYRLKVRRKPTLEPSIFLDVGCK